MGISEPAVTVASRWQDSDEVATAGGSAQMSERVGFDDFVQARSDRLLRTAYLLTRDRGLAEDLLQTALAKVWFVWPRISGDPEPYVRKVLVNTFASWWRRKWNGETPHGDLPEGSQQRAGDADARMDVWSALGRLPKRQRAVIVLRFFDHLSERETAAVLECSAGTVKSQTSKALAKLRVDPSVQRSTSEEW